MSCADFGDDAKVAQSIAWTLEFVRGCILRSKRQSLTFALFSMQRYLVNTQTPFSLLTILVAILPCSTRLSRRWYSSNAGRDNLHRSDRLASGSQILLDNMH